MNNHNFTSTPERSESAVCHKPGGVTWLKPKDSSPERGFNPEVPPYGVSWGHLDHWANDTQWFEYVIPAWLAFACGLAICSLVVWSFS